MMTFKQFVAWCNERACDGCWGMNTAIACIATIQEVRKEKFWRRRRRWAELGPEICERFVDPTNELIKERMNGAMTK